MKKCGFVSLAALATVGLLSGCVGAPESNRSTEAAGDYQPVTVTNCGVETTFTAVPQHAVTTNQGATEMMLGLGLEDKMVGTAYLDDHVTPSLQKAFDKVPVLSDQSYPSKEKFFEVDPDFAYSAYSSAFTEKNLGSREQLKASGVNTRIIPYGCPEKKDQPSGASMDPVWEEAMTVAKIFGITERGQKVVQEQKDRFAALEKKAPAKGKKFVWYDSGDKDPYIGAGEGGPQLIINALGGKNIFESEKGNWAHLSWESVLEADPDFIVVADPTWDTAAKKIDYMKNDPVLSQLRAVKNDAFLKVKFSESTPGLSLINGAENLADQLAKLN